MQGPFYSVQIGYFLWSSAPKISSQNSFWQGHFDSYVNSGHSYMDSVNKTFFKIHKWIVVIYNKNERFLKFLL